MNAVRQIVRVVVHAAWQKRTRCAPARQPANDERQEGAAAATEGAAHASVATANTRGSLERMMPEYTR